MRIDVIRFEPHTYLWGLSNFQLRRWFLQLRSCLIAWHEKERSFCFDTLNLLHVSSCEMFQFCDVLHETKQKTQTNSRECAVRTWNHLYSQSDSKLKENVTWLAVSLTIVIGACEVKALVRLYPEKLYTQCHVCRAITCAYFLSTFFFSFSASESFNSNFLHSSSVFLVRSSIELTWNIHKRTLSPSEQKRLPGKLKYK